MVLNQSGAAAVMAMADQADEMYRTLQNTAGQSSVASDLLFQELEEILFELPAKLEEMAQKMQAQGVEGSLK